MKSLIQTASSSEERLERIGFLRILNEENTIIPCLLSVAPVLDHIIILWSDTEDRSIELMEAWKRHIEDNYECRMSFLHYPHHVVPPRSVDDLRILPRENRIDTYLNFGMDFIRDLYAGKSFCVGKVDADQIYFTQELEEAFQMARKPEDLRHEQFAAFWSRCTLRSGHCPSPLHQSLFQSLLDALPEKSQIQKCYPGIQGR